ncbi:uncharacterized protein LOC142579414 [Dermacentor variabilis]|uniref:uncharacterized protein LOC142579414 n=1 Tax=Dermacentor variabilis TaxID=34621 RepID=UPI003F5B147F
MPKSRSTMDYSGKKKERRTKTKNENPSRKSPARYDDGQDYDETYQKPTARRKKSKSSRVAITDSPTFSKSSESPTNRHEGSAVVTSGDESSSLPKELNYEYFEKLGGNLCRAGELLDEHERGIVWQAADVITCIPEYCPPRCYMTKLCRCNTCCERCCVDPEHRLTGFHSNVKDEATDVPDEEGLTLSGSSDTSVTSLLGDVSSEEGKSRGSTRLAIAARDAKRAVRLAKQFRAAARTIDSLECSNESEHRMRALYTKELMDKAVFYAKKANEALAGYAALRRALRGIPEATSGDESTQFDTLQGEQTPYRPAPYPAQGYGSAMEFAMRYPQQPSAQSPFGQGVRGTVGQGYRFGGPRGVQGPLDAQRLRWASAPVVGRPPSQQTALSLSRMSDIVMSKAQQASEDVLRFQRISNEMLAEARVFEGVSNDRLPPFELKGARSSYWLPAAVPETDQRYVQDRAADLRPSGAVAFDDTMTMCAIGKDGHMLRIPEHTRADSDRQPEQLNDQMMRISTEEKRSARKDGKSDLKVDLMDRGGPRATGPTTTPPPNRVARRASVSAKDSGRRASVSSIQQELSDTAQSPQPRKTKSLAARRASVGAGLLLKLGARMKDGSDDLSPDREPSMPGASPDSTHFKARATRRASVSSKAYSAHPLNEDADSFKARATRRASVSSKGLPTSPDRITADHDSFKARSSRRASVSSKTISPSEANTRNEQYHLQTKALRRASTFSRDFPADLSDEHKQFKAKAARRASVSSNRLAVPTEGDEGSFKAKAARRASVSSVGQQSFKAKAARRASVSSGTLSPDLYNLSAGQHSFKAKAARRASVSSGMLSPDLYNLSPEQHSFKAKAARRASVSSGMLSPDLYNLSPEQHSFKAKAARRASVSSGMLSPDLYNLSAGQHSFKAKAARRASVSSKSAKSTEGPHERFESFKAKTARRTSVSAMSPEGPQKMSESFKVMAARGTGASSVSPESPQEMFKPFKPKAARKGTGSDKSPEGPHEESESFKAKAARRASVSAKLSEGLHDSQHESFKAKAARRASVSSKGLAQQASVQKLHEAKFRRASVFSTGRTSPQDTPTHDSRTKNAKETKMTVVEPDVSELSIRPAKKPPRRASVCAAKYKRLYGDVTAEQTTKTEEGYREGSELSDEPAEPNKQARRLSISAAKQSSDVRKAGSEKNKSNNVPASADSTVGQSLTRDQNKSALSEGRDDNKQPPATTAQEKTLLSQLRDSLKSSAARAGAEETRDKKGGRIVVKIKPPPVLMSSKKVGTRHTDKDKDLVSEICDECLLNKCGSQPTDPRDIQKIIDEGVGAPKYTKDMDSTQASSPRIPEILYELSEQSLDIEVIPSERCKEAQTSLPFDGASSKEHHWGRAVTSTNSNATKEAAGNKNLPSAKSASRHQKNIGRASLEKQAIPDSHGGDAHAHLKVLPSDTYVFTATTVAIAGGDTTNPKAAKVTVEGAKKKPKESDAAGSARKSSGHSNESPKRESGAKKHSTHSKESLKHKSGAEKPSRPSNESLRHEAGKESTRSESGARKHSKESLKGETGAEKPSRPSNESMKRKASSDSLRHDSGARKHSTHSKESVKGETGAGRPSGPSNESLRREAGATNKRRSSLKSTKGSSDSHNEKSNHEKVLPTRVEKGAGERDTTGKPENRTDKKADEGKRKALKDMRISDEHVKDRKASVGKDEDDNGSKNVKNIDEGIKRRNASVKKGEDESGKALDNQTESGGKREGKEKVRGSGTEQAAEEIRDKTDKTGGKDIRDSDDETPQPSTTDGAHPKSGDKFGEKRPSAGYLNDAKKTAGKHQPSKVVESVDATKAASQPHDGGSNAPVETQTESNAPPGFLNNLGVLASWYSTAGEKGRAEDTTSKHTAKADTPRVLATNIRKVANNFDGDQQTKIPVTVVADSSAEPPQKILSTNEKRESTSTTQDDVVNDRYKQVAASSAYFPEGEEMEIRPMDDDDIYDYQQLAFADRQNIIGSSSSGADVAGSQRDNAREVGQRSAELVLPKKLAFGAVDDWTALSPLEKFAEDSDSDHAMDRSRPERSEYAITSEAVKLDPRNARMYETEQTRELRDDITAEEDLQPEANYSLDQQQEWEQPEGELPYGEPLERELPEEELLEGESPQEETPQQDISEQEFQEDEARIVENGIAVNIHELEDLEGVEQPQNQGIQEMIELQNVDYELQSRPHAPLRGPDLQNFNFWDLDGPAVLFPESRLVFALALVAGMWILYLMFTTKATINRKPFLELFTALATEHEIPRGRIMTETFAVNHLKTKEIAGTVMGSVVSARPWLLYFCDTPYCKESALQLAKMLGEDPCFNFYSYTCGKLTRKWNPMVGSALSTDAFIINEAAKLAAGHILNREHPGMKAARNLLEACLDHENDGQWSRTELSELFFEYFGSSWPAENNPLTMEAVWVIAGRLARDLKLEALARVSVGIHPEGNSASVPTIGEPVLLYQRADFEEPGYTEMLETAIGQTVMFISPASNGAQHVSSIKTTMELLADMVSTYPASYVDAKEHRMTKVRVLSPGVRAFLRTVFPDSVKVAENADILIKSPRFFEKLQGSRSTLLDPQAVFNYVGFRVMVHFAAFLPQQSVRHLRALEANFLLPENASAQDFCTREVERVFPAIYARAFALQTANLSTWVSEWPSQLKRIFLQGLGFRATRIHAPQAAPTSDQDNDAGFARRRLDSLRVEAAVPLWIVNDSSFDQYAQELERQLSVTLNLDPSNSLKRLCFFAKMLRENEIQQALLGTSANQTAMSLFGTEARYDARNSAVYMPLVTVNWSVPASSIASAIHAARYAVRVFKALGLALRLGYAHASEQRAGSDMYSKRYHGQRNATTRCLVEQYENASRSLKSAFLQKTADRAPLGAALLDQTDALVQAYTVFKEELSARRFGHSNFRLVGLPRLTPEQLFFVAYGHDNCEASDTVHRRRRWLESGELPPEDRVNIPLMHFEEFTRAFGCNSTAPMSANRRCPMVRTRTSQDE